MHFEQLSICGFGPYADAQHIDFVELSKKGLFSVTGETGAGKTTIFDALTYALYGEVPGARSSGSVRSQHATPHQPSEVQLQFTAGSDRWKVIRSPQFDRAKSKGNGTTIQRPRAALHRWVAGEWEPLSADLREINAQCQQLAGLTREQFERVGLLPQGEFKRLLHAKSKDRKELFRTLFGTVQVEDAVRLLADHAKIAEANADRARQQFDELTLSIVPLRDQLQEWSEQFNHDVLTLPGMGRDTADPSSDQDPLTQLDVVANDVDVRVLPQLRNIESDRLAAATTASTALGRAAEQAAQVALREQLQQQRLFLDGQRAEIEAGAVAAERAERAAPLLEIHERLVARQTARDDTSNAVALARQKVERLARLVELPADLAADPTLHQRTVFEQIPEVRSAVSRRAELARLQHQSTTTSQNISAAEERHAYCLAEEQQLTVAIAETNELMTQAKVARASLRDLEGAAAPLTALKDRAVERDQSAELMSELAQNIAAANAQIEGFEAERQQHLTLVGQTAEAEQALRDATETHGQAQKHLASLDRSTTVADELETVGRQLVDAASQLNNVTSAYVAGVAPRLAKQLTAGDPCAVCGSTDHPAPAVDADAELVDEATLNEANAAHGRAATRVAVLDAELQSLLAAVPEGLDRQTALQTLNAAADAIESAQASVSATAAAREQLTELDHKLATMRAMVSEADKQLHGQTVRHSSAITSLGEHAELSVDELTQRIDDANAEIERVGAIAARLEPLRADNVERTERTAALQAERTDLIATIAGLTAKQTEIAGQIATRSDQLADWDGVDLDRRLADLETLKTSLERLIEAISLASQAEAAVATGESEFESAVEASGFPTVAEVFDSSLPADRVAELVQAHTTFREQEELCTSGLKNLADLDVPESAPDLTMLTQAEDQARRAATKATEQRTSVENLIRDARAKIAQTTRRSGQVVDLVATADRHRAIADLCDAKGVSKIGLEGFILRNQLALVVTQANLRLDSLSRGRYQLQLADEALDGRGEWGLDLTIVDAHTGAARPVTTLSGGETFYTSLSLALGLSDVLSDRGATAISSVFIDEGFGSLDEAAVEDTIDVLSQLRSDGVTIGVITHVRAMRDALPEGLVVEKLRSGGSRVSQAA